VTVLESLAWPALGTTAVLRTEPLAALAVAARLLEAELRAVDEACSRFRPDAELVAVNAVAGRWVELSPLLSEAIDVALQAARQTEGAVDPTVGAALRRLGYDRDYALLGQGGAPLTMAFEPAPGWQHVEFDPARRRVRVPPGVELDLGATAKALAADRAAAQIWQETGAGVLVGLGGDLAIAGSPPDGGWPVRVTDDHRSAADAPGQTISVSGGGLATSSSTTRVWKRGDDTLHHIVDPTTGRSATGPWRTVSVAAGSCVDANTAATAALVVGASAAGWLDAAGLPARLVDHEGQVRTVAGWPEDPS
jgi:thiamine biosynthesis lipoprotein